MDRYQIEENFEIDITADLTEDLWDNFEYAVNISAGHTAIHSAGENSVLDSVKRVIRESTTNVSFFYSNEDALGLAQDVCVSNVEKISAWMQTKRQYFKEQADYRNLVLTLNLRQDAGYGFVAEKDKLIERTARAVTVVLERNYSDDCPYGFHLKTAYPNILEEHAIDTGRIFSKRDIINEAVELNPEERAVLALKGAQTGVTVRYYEPSQIRLAARSKDTEYTVFLGRNRFKAQKNPIGQKGRPEWASKAEIAANCPKLNDALAEAEAVLKREGARYADMILSGSILRQNQSSFSGRGTKYKEL